MKLASIFTDHMVLQRDMPLYIFGTGEGKVKVTFLGETAEGTSENGKWRVKLSPKPFGGPYEMKIDLGGEELVLRDILIGDVFLASGQSNMEMPLFATESGFSDAVNCDNASIRYFTVPRRYKKGVDTYGYHFAGMYNCDTPWQIKTEEASLNFTAIGHYFAEYLQKEVNVPIGIISCNWGGRRIEAFIEKSYFYGVPSLDGQMKAFNEFTSSLDMEEYEKDFKKFTKDVEEYIKEKHKGKLDETRRLGVYAVAPKVNLDDFPQKLKGPYDSVSPSVLWESMFSEIVPFGVRAMLWYQGESNGYDRDYLEKYLTFLKCIREQFECDMDVYAVELAPYIGSHADLKDIADLKFITGNNWAFLREDQQKATLMGDKNYLVTSAEQGDIFEIHPKRKKEIARRLSLKAMKHTYGMDILADQPIFKSVEFKDGKAYITLYNADGLYGQTGGVEMLIAGKDKVLKRGVVSITEDNRLVVHSPEVPEPEIVRYGFGMYYFGKHIYNGAGLPLAPFRTDKD
ncbi:MAG: hypothetical protein IKL74_01660 [Clostridia bacterium]|nr:hypothetical protein [Clostridia bacterium]